MTFVYFALRVMRRQDFFLSAFRQRPRSEYGNLLFHECFMTVVKCPVCGREAQYEGNEFRPFCSERCKLLDFGAWADQEYALPAESSEMTEEDIDQIERALEEKTE